MWLVPRTDENGRQLKALLDYLLDGDVDAKDDLRRARHLQQHLLPAHQGSDYPNAEELRLVADRFGLSYPDLQVRFGLMSRRRSGSYVESAHAPGAPPSTMPETTANASASTTEAVRTHTATRRSAAVATLC